MPLYLIDWTLNTILHREEICTAGRGEKSEASDNWKTQNTNNMKKKNQTQILIILIVNAITKSSHPHLLSSFSELSRSKSSMDRLQHFGSLDKSFNQMVECNQRHT